MNKTETHAFVNHLLIYTIVMICFSGSVGVGAVWLRHQISITANRNKQLESRIADIERRVAQTTAAVETEQRPDVLLRHNEEWQLGLVRPQERQVVERVNGDVAIAYAAKRNRRLFADVEFAPITVRHASTR